MTEKIAVLLERLKELDRETWDALSHALYWTEIEYEEYVIQGVIQEAIAARSQWCWSANSIIMSPVYEAEIHVLNDDDYYDDFFGKGDTPAEALLRAYIAALEAEK